jgi:cation transport ATPase
MNLDELKHIWKAHTDHAASVSQVSISEIQRMIQQRSQSALAKINRNMALDLLAMTLVGGALIFWMWQNDFSFNTAEIIVMSAIIIGISLFYWQKYRLLNRASLTTDNLKDSLTEITRVLGIFMKIYFYSIVILVPLLGSGGILYGFYKGGNQSGRDMENIPPEVWGIVGITMIVYSALAVLASRWYVNRLFGIHYRELNLCLQELEEHH